MFALLLTQVHFSMASDPLQLLRGANRPTKSMMPYYVDAVPVEEAFTKHVPPSQENLSKCQSAGRSELEAAFAPVPEGGPGYESAENESDADQDVGEL